MGRPSKYSDKLALAISNQVADGATIDEICDKKTMPCPRTVYRWLTAHDEFCQHYTRARQVKAARAFDGINALAKTATPETVQIIRLRVDTLKWSLGRENPSKYGDRQALEVTGADGGPIENVIYIDKALKDV